MVKQMYLEQEEGKEKLAHDVVLRLLKRNHGKEHVVVMNNFFSSIENV